MEGGHSIGQARLLRWQHPSSDPEVSELEEALQEHSGNSHVQDSRQRRGADIWHAGPRQWGSERQESLLHGALWSHVKVRSLKFFLRFFIVKYTQQKFTVLIFFSTV